MTMKSVTDLRTNLMLEILPAHKVAFLLTIHTLESHTAVHVVTYFLFIQWRPHMPCNPKCLTIQAPVFKGYFSYSQYQVPIFTENMVANHFGLEIETVSTSILVSFFLTYVLSLDFFLQVSPSLIFMLNPV